MEFGSAFPADGEALERVEQDKGLLDDVTEFALRFRHDVPASTAGLERGRRMAATA